MKHELKTQSLNSGYGEKIIVHDMNITIPQNKISVIIGGNGCGKSTLLKTLSRLIKPSEGCVKLDDKDIRCYDAKRFARSVALLPQSPAVPEGISVYDLVCRGRFPHRRLMKSMTKADFNAVDEALSLMGITHLADSCVDELSGGQRQRVWIALALAQQTDILLLDEPTTYLDIAYQVEILNILRDLNEKKGLTIIMVLHDINLSARYAHHLFAMKKGKLIAQGSPKTILTKELVKDVFDLDCNIMEDPYTNTPLVLPAEREGYLHNVFAEKRIV